MSNWRPSEQLFSQFNSIVPGDYLVAESPEGTEKKGIINGRDWRESRVHIIGMGWVGKDWKVLSHLKPTAMQCEGCGEILQLNTFVCSGCGSADIRPVYAGKPGEGMEVQRS